ncbi:SusC/RagA family TonB-linked outer membrane protein [Mucilaginibacter sp. KACC 22773]|uniref:SusC/RagA family TonB-linked outer membrane protein n=1 Tax=Mucilaginibacter sp. KACC 22773 TaxID=3025671 RepID=UPI002366F243|nr:SusC/RagA family TonB-linked outer membrane protein [Mucilaginibacter sp. KACC 22773]WDF77189.1 SusC/RagA family TonB-linked outer membrane protein [Mucilaginibacter sp. KACC 22773]
MQKKLAFAKGKTYVPLIKFLRLNGPFIMKVSICYSAVFMLSLSLFASTKTIGQSINKTAISFPIRHVSLKTALQKLQEQSGYNVFYSTPKVNDYQNITIDGTSRTVAETLDRLLKNTDLEYQQEGNSIIIKEKIPANVTSAMQAKRISGIVVDEKGQSLPGVTVQLRLDKHTRTATDENGVFQIDVSNDNDILIFSFVGYVTQEIPLPLSSHLKVTMKPNVGSLNEVQIIGYGTTTKRLNTGSVSSITSEDLSRETVDNPLQALSGRIAGLQIVQNNGNPGANQSIRLRGVNNLTGSFGQSSSAPLIIIDGVPSVNLSGFQPLNDNLNPNIIGANGGLTLFAGLNPQDIERVDVLKDADATAIYGSRGANGVILLTTKKGKAGTSQLNVNFYNGIEKVGHFVPLLNTQEYLQLRKEAFANDGVTPRASNAPDLLTWDPNAYTNFQKLLIGGTSHTTDAQLNYTGGNDRIQFFTSGNYHHEGSVYMGNYGDTRLIGRMTLTTNSSNKRFKTNFSVSYTDEQTNLPSADVSNALSLPPNFPLYNPDGTLYWFGTTFTNPMATLLKQYGSSTQFFIANGNLDYNFFKGFNFKLNAGYTRNVLNQTSTNPLLSQNPITATSNSAQFATSVATNYIVEPQLNYNLHNGKNNLLALVGSTFQQSDNSFSNIFASGYAFPGLLTSISGAGTYTATSDENLYKYAAAFGKVNYNYDNKYLVDITFRRDASSRFGPNHQFANFGAIGGGWIFTDEPFVKNNLKFLSFGKLRASYGTTGNDQLLNYQYLALFRNATAYQGSSALTLNGVANPNVEWESTKKLGFGLELGFFKDRLLFTADAYVHRSSNLLTATNLPNQTGFNSYYANLDAIVQNKGFEFTITSTNVDTKDFKWTSNFNISFQTTKMLSFNSISTAFYGSTFLVGYPVPPAYYYSYGGVNPNTGAVIINDRDGNGTINTVDRYPAGIRNPYYGGLTNTLNYKQFSLNFFLQFNHDYGTINQVFGTRPGSLSNQNVSVLNRWQKPGDVNTLFPGASAVSGGTGVIYPSYATFGQSDFYYGDASWLKLRSASFSYMLPAAFTRKIKVSNARVYLQGQNLLTWAKNKYVLDPESRNALPPLRTIVAGLNFTIN